MSQISRIINAGVMPPVVPLQFTADDATIGVPAANNFNLFSNDTSDNNSNGIQTTTVANGSDNHYTQLTNRITGTATTTDNSTPQTLTSFNLGATPSTYILEIRIIAFNVTDGLSAGYTSTSTIRTDGAAGTEISANPGIISEETTMVDVIVQNQITGNNVETIVTGLNLKTINWAALTTYIKVS